MRITKLIPVNPQTIRNNNNILLLLCAIKFGMVCYIPVDNRMKTGVQSEERALTPFGTICKCRQQPSKDQLILCRK